MEFAKLSSRNYLKRDVKRLEETEAVKRWKVHQIPFSHSACQRQKLQMPHKWRAEWPCTSGKGRYLQIALGPGANQRYLRRDRVRRESSLTSPFRDWARPGILQFPFSWPHPAFPGSSITACYDLQPILSPTSSFMFFSVYPTHCWEPDLPAKPPEAELVSSIFVHLWLPVKIPPLEPLSHCNVIVSVHTCCPHLLVSSRRTAPYPQCFTFSLWSSKQPCTLL